MLAYSISPGMSVGRPDGGLAVGLLPGPGVGVGEAPGRGVGPGVGLGVGFGDAPASAASRSRSADPSESDQTTCRGEATTIRLNSGNAEPVDWR